jgi:hypothetical protein
MDKYIYGEKKTSKQIEREQKKGIEKESRNLEKEKLKLQQQEQQMINDMKNAARKGDT